MSSVSGRTRTGARCSSLCMSSRMAGGAEELLEAAAVLGVARDAEARGGGEGIVGEGVADGAAEAVGEDVGAVLVGLGQEQGELLAAHAGDDVDPALGALEDARDGGEPLVGHAVAELVVDVLEAVEVDDDDAEAAVDALGALELPVEELLETRAVEETGARVALGGLGNLVDEALDTSLQEADEHGGQDPGADGEEPAAETEVQRGVGHFEVGAVGRGHEGELYGGAPDRETKSRAERRPDVPDRHLLVGLVPAQREPDRAERDSHREGGVNRDAGKPLASDPEDDP